MKVAGIQMDIAWEDPEKNFQRVEAEVARLMGEAGSQAGGGPELIVLPEMFATGFSMDAERMAAFAEDTRAFLANLASSFSLHVLAGYAEPAEPLPANACSVVSPAGEEILHYRKIHPFSLAKEDENYLAGDAVSTVKVENVRITPFICYDLRFPEPFRPPAPNTDLYCVIANWPDMRRSAWSALLRARAIENQAFVLGVNRVGMGSGKPHSGDSALLDPMGETLAELEPYQEGVVLGSVDPREVEKVRRQLGFLNDRRPDLYCRLEGVRD
ncbi:MAG: nitrilase-related carbon-nitrogen hydrolase [Gemmatimonadota bacterium]|jgi:predicted amidohydrolase